mgnify:CR=1 FL=1|jgi:hypothetical protein
MSTGAQGLLTLLAISVLGAVLFSVRSVKRDSAKGLVPSTLASAPRDSEQPAPAAIRAQMESVRSARQMAHGRRWAPPKLGGDRIR